MSQRERAGVAIRPRRPENTAWLAPAFLASGFSALIYQVVWQRVLFTAFGINIEAVTIVVTAFLLGLGLGSLFGGWLAKKSNRHPIKMFAVLEACVGGYGIISVPLFRGMSDITATWPSGVTAVATFGLVLVPTLFMGATLPLLVAFAVRQSGLVGRSVGAMYFVNTAGSAIASMAAALVLMRALGETGSVRLAALVNALIVVTVLSQQLRRRLE